MREFWEVMHVMPAFCVSNMCVISLGAPLSSVCCHIPPFGPSTLTCLSSEQPPLTSLSALGTVQGKPMTEGERPTLMSHKRVCFNSQASADRKVQGTGKLLVTTLRGVLLRALVHFNSTTCRNSCIKTYKPSVSVCPKWAFMR